MKLFIPNFNGGAADVWEWKIISPRIIQAYDYIFMLVLILIEVDKRGPFDP